MNTVPELIKRVAHRLTANDGPPQATTRRHFTASYGLPNSELHLETFEYFNPAAHEVLLAGTFNDWQPQANPMTNHRGKWSTQLFLRPGKYEYRLVVDGQWQNDPIAAAFAPNSLSGLNCVREVKASDRRTRARPMPKKDIVFWQGRAMAYPA